jgi:flagellar basal-body rod protein FlgC
VSLFSIFSISASGMAAQRTRVELLAQNLANAETTRTPEGGPYRRQDAVFESEPVISTFASLLDFPLRTVGFGSAPIGPSGGVRVADVVVDSSEPERRYAPGHPDADAAGFVAFPRIHPAEDMVDLMGAAQSYHANVAAISAVKDMIQRSLDLFR